MENTTHFHLKTSVQKWSEELAAQPGVTPESRRELETHLLETVSELAARGLNEEESFWLACRRVGHPRQLGEEFARANPWPVWKRWALWIATAMLMVRIFQGAFAGVSGLLGLIEARSDNVSRNEVQFWWADGLRDGLADTGIDEGMGALAVICGTILIGRSSASVSSRLWRLFFQSRARFLMIGVLAVLVMFALERWSEGINDGSRMAQIRMWIDGGIANANPYPGPAFPLGLVVLITWLIPSVSGGKPQPASSPKEA